MNRHRTDGMAGPAVYVALLLIAVAVFQWAPGIDLAVSREFYVSGHGFVLDTWWPVVALVAMIPWVVGLIVVVVILGAAWLAWCGRPWWRFDRQALVFVVLSTALGPGLLANTVLKDHWGRARPVQIAVFGGIHRFTPPLVPSSECLRNCSFVSGHAALAFGLVAFALLLPPGRRRAWCQGAALGFGALVGLARIAEGGHFLSDVIFAGLLVYATTWLLHAGIVKRDGLGPPAQWVWRIARPMLVNSVVVPCLAGLFVVEAILMVFVDRPFALYLHDHGTDVHPLFVWLGDYGVGYPYLILSAIAFLFMRWSGALPALRARAAAMRGRAWVPGFLFAAMAGSGLITDLVKVVCGRTRPKLLFAVGAYQFTGFATRADHWSFPSGHATTIVALMTALWCLWPRYLVFYVLVATIVAGARVVIGQHYPSDVVMGAGIAIAATLAIYRIFAESRVDRASVHRSVPDSGRMPRIGRRV